MTHEQRIATLVLEGWRPVRSRYCEGIYNFDLQVGFAVVQGASPSDPLGYNIGKVMQINGLPTPEMAIAWVDIRPSLLDTIEVRLGQT